MHHEDTKDTKQVEPTVLPRQIFLPTFAPSW